MRRQIIFALVLGLNLGACVVMVPVDLGTQAAKTPTRPWPVTASCPLPARSATDGPRVVALLNAERAKSGLAPVRLSPALGAVAHAFACEIAGRGGDIGHVGSDGSSLRERVQRGGVDASTVAENNAAGQRSAEEVVAAWMASPHHRANMLRAGVSFVGLGQADSPLPIWVLDFSS